MEEKRNQKGSDKGTSKGSGPKVRQGKEKGKALQGSDPEVSLADKYNRVSVGRRPFLERTWNIVHDILTQVLRLRKTYRFFSTRMHIGSLN